MRLYEAAIAGGGPAGASLAIELALAGRPVIVFEKERGPHDKVCGEFMSHEGAHYLGLLGISLEDLGTEPIHFVRLARKGEAVTAALPFQAYSLSRKVLDEALLRRAEEAGAEVSRGARVRKMVRSKDHWAIRLYGGASALAREAFLATGKHDLREWKRPAGMLPELIAFKSYWKLQPSQARDLAGHVELILFPEGYAGLQPVENGRANLCLLVRKDAFATRYRSWDELLGRMLSGCPHLKKRLAGALPLLEKPLAIAGLPYGYVARESGGPWRIGDQAAVIPSFSGDGMSIALHSAALAAQFYLGGKTAPDYQKHFAKHVLRHVWRATAISQLLLGSNGQRISEAITRCVPQTLPLAARLTRIPHSSITRLQCV